jgi:hypothetical protein
MMIRGIFSVAVSSIIFLCSCTKERVKSDNQLFGEWIMLDSPSKGKKIILEPDGKADFVGVNIEDFGREEKGSLPVSGTWKLLPNGDEIEFWFAFSGGDYGEVGKLIRKNEDLEIRFGVGDPDDFAWKRFRLMKPKAD